MPESRRGSRERFARGPKPAKVSAVRVQQPRSGKLAVAVAVGLLACLGGCDSARAPVDSSEDDSPALDLTREASLEWLACPPESPCGLRASVALREVACSAAIGCSEALLHDGSETRQPTLVTGFGCDFPVGADAQDALLGFHPRLLCYDGGDPADASTWEPAGGVALTPAVGGHIFYAQADPLTGNDYLDTASLLAPTAAHAFCVFEAWGFVVFSPADGAPRRLAHEQHATAIAWRGLIVPNTDGSFACHEDDNTRTWVHRTVAVSITHDVPDPAVKGALPASHPIVMVLDDVAGGDRSPGLRVVAAERSTFPERPGATPDPFLERVLSIDLPGAALHPTWTCPDVVDGALADVAVRIEDADLHAPLGTLIVRSSVSDGAGARAWDCERGASGDCVVYDDTEVLTAAPCLIPVVLGGG